MTTRAKEASASKTRSSKAAPASSSTSTAALVGFAVAGVAAGLAANLGRKAIIQAPSALTGDWFEALKAEHRAALALFDALEATDAKQERKRAMLLMQLKHALGKHAFTEENAIYPALREWGGKADADKLNHDHGYVKQHLYALGSIPKGSPEFLTRLATFRAELETHIREEEDAIFPPFHAALGDEKNKALTTAANKEGFKLA